MEYFKNKKNITNVGILVVAVIISFYAGTMYSKSSIPARGQFGQPGMMGSGNQFGGQGGATRGMRGNGVVAGEIISKDATSITVKAPDGSSKIVLVSGTTQIAKSTTGTQADLATGTSVTVIGTTNADGSVTAQSVQIRPLEQSQ
ncbi:MAG: hypothetical protein WC791_00065 [Candidatus Paceibacterota bacterium]|jgi:hypothetical protein